MKKKIQIVTARIFVLATVVVKNLTVLFKIKGLNYASKRLKANTMATNLDDQVLTFGVMAPTTTVVKGYVTTGNQLALDRADAEILVKTLTKQEKDNACLLYTSPSPRD